MHHIGIRQEIIDRVMERRGRVHLFDRLDPRKTALVVIDMQNTFCDESSPAQVPLSRAIVPNINALTPRLRALDVPVIWCLHANTNYKGRSDWNMFYDYIVAGDKRTAILASNAPENQAVYSKLNTDPVDVTIVKNRYSALITGSSPLERVMRALGLDTMLIAGTKTNICCESTARDAAMLDFKVVMLSDCCAALSDEEHRGTLENIVQQFGDVLTSEEALQKLQAPRN
jgi:ureidoacrylate peracid hydrolase